MNQKTYKRRKQVKMVKRRLHFLMSGILVLSTVLPLTTVFAESESTQSEPVLESSSERLEETEATIEKQSVESDNKPEKSNNTDTQETNPPMSSDLLTMPNSNISIPLDEKTTIWMIHLSQTNGISDNNIFEDISIYDKSFNDVQRWTYNDYMQENAPGADIVKALLVGSDLVNGLIDAETALPLLQEYTPDNNFTTIEEVQDWMDRFFAPYVGKSLEEEELTALMDKPIELIDDPVYSGDLRVKDPLVYNFVDNNVNVKIHYVYSDGTKAAEDRDLTAYVGKSSVTIDSPVIEGYEADQPAVDVDFSKEGLTEYTVTYYKPGERPQLGGQVTIQYVDEEGNPIADEVIKSGNIGESYTSGQKEIDGYTFKEVKGNPRGEFTETEQTVTYVYTKDPVKAGDITVRYEDEEGNELSEVIIMSGNVGDSYSSEQKDFPGYRLKEVKGAASGTFGIYPQQVVYVYQKEASSTDQTDTSNDKKPMDSIPPTEKGAASNDQNPRESGNVPPVHSQNGSYTKNNTKEGKKDRELPQTGEKNSIWLILIGLVVIILIVGTWLFKRKNK